MTAARKGSPLLFIDNRRTKRNRRGGQKDRRRKPLDYAAFFARHFQALHRPRSLAADACDAPACGKSRRPQPSAPTRERCGSSGLRSLRDPSKATATDSATKTSTPGSAPNRRNRLTIPLGTPPEGPRTAYTSVDPSKGSPSTDLKRPSPLQSSAPRGSAFAATSALHLCPADGQTSTGATYTGVVQFSTGVSGRIFDQR